MTAAMSTENKVEALAPARRVPPTWIEHGDPTARADGFVDGLSELEGHHHVVRLTPTTLVLDGEAYGVDLAHHANAGRGLMLFGSYARDPHSGYAFGRDGDTYPVTVLVDLACFAAVHPDWQAYLLGTVLEVERLWPDRWVNLIVYGSEPARCGGPLRHLLDRLDSV